METYTLAELADRAGRALDALGVRVGNGRVRERPDARTIRYYTQAGLVDRPVATGGRTVEYGRRHLAQVVAVKRLQASGVSLAEVQRRLAGASDAELLEVLGPDGERVLDEEAPTTTRGSRPAAFWRAGPTGGTATAHATTPAAGRVAGRRLLAVPLAPGAELVVDLAVYGEAADAVDATALRRAARPLLDLLHADGAQPTGPDEGDNR